MTIHIIIATFQIPMKVLKILMFIKNSLLLSTKYINGLNKNIHITLQNVK